MSDVRSSRKDIISTSKSTNMVVTRLLQTRRVELTLGKRTHVNLVRGNVGA